MQRTIFDAEHEAFRDSVARFLQKEVAPKVEGWREAGSVDRETWLAAGRQGLLCPWVDEAYGGAGMADFRWDMVIAEEILKHTDPALYIPLHNRIVAPYIQHFGSEEQRRQWLPRAVSGQAILAVAMTEPGTGSDLAGIRTKAEDKGDRWLLNGSKTYISNGILADVVIVAARTDPNSSHGLTLFLVERGMPGFERGRRLKKMGLDAQDTAELFFHNVEVPKSHVLGQVGKGFVYLASNLAEERLMCALQSLAHANVAFDLTLQFVKDRRAFGKPIGAFQNTRFQLAQLRAELDCQQVFVDQLALRHIARELDAVSASKAKLLATELEGRVLDACVQLHGGAGYMDEYRVSRMYRDGRISRIFAGTNEIMKEIIGRSLGLDERKMN